MSDEERERIRQAGAEAGRRAAEQQGLSAKVTDAETVERIAALLREPERQAGEEAA